MNQPREKKTIASLSMDAPDEPTWSGKPGPHKLHLTVEVRSDGSRLLIVNGAAVLTEQQGQLLAAVLGQHVTPER